MMLCTVGFGQAELCGNHAHIVTVPMQLSHFLAIENHSKSRARHLTTVPTRTNALTFTSVAITCCTPSTHRRGLAATAQICGKASIIPAAEHFSTNRSPPCPGKSVKHAEYPLKNRTRQLFRT